MKKLKHNSCYLAGDIHGEPEPLFSMLEQYKLNNDCDIILLGDIGLGFYEYDKHSQQYKKIDDKIMLNSINDWAKNNNADIWLLRGNHDDPNMFTEEFLSNFFNLHVLKDGDIVTDKNDKKYLIVSGAISIDRYARKQGISYWDNEPIQEHIYQNLDIQEIEGIFAHTGPKCYGLEINDTFIEKIKRYKDGAIVDDLEKEQKTINNIIDRFKPKYWYNGHYHFTHKFDYTTPQNNFVRVTYIDICDIVPLYPLY